MALHGLFHAIFYFFLGLLYHLISIVTYLTFLAFRFVVNILLDKNKYRTIDLGIETDLAGDLERSINVLFVLKCTGTPNVDKIVDKLYRMVKHETTLVSGGHTETPYRPFKRLSYVMVKKLGILFWNVGHNFRAENHVVIDKVNRSLDVEIQEKCESLLDTSHANHQPQWKIYILNRNESKEYAIVWCVHHSYADGTMFTQAIRYALADDPFPIKVDPLEWKRKEERSLCTKIVYGIETLLLCTIGGWFAGICGQFLSQNRVKENDLTESRGKSHCRTVTLNLTDVKTIQRKFNKENPVRLVSILFAYLSAALERALSSSKSDEKPLTVLARSVEAHLPYKSLELCVNIYCPGFDLPLNVKPIDERLQIIDTSMIQAGRLERSLKAIVADVMGSVISAIPNLNEPPPGSFNHTTYISNMVGPQNYFTIFGGDLVTSMYVYTTIVMEEIVAVQSYTYGDKLTLGLVASDRVIKKFPKFMDDVATGIEDEMVKYIALCKSK